jgi:hypothetical protein
MRRLVAGLIVLLLGGALRAQEPPDFAPVIQVLNTFRAGSGDGLAVRVGTNSFEVRQLRETAIQPAAAQQLIPKDAGPPELRLTEGGLWIDHRIDLNRTVSQPLPSQANQQVNTAWRQKTWVRVARYPREVWPAFVEVALRNGLNGIHETRFGDSTVTSLSFSPPPVASFNAGAQIVTLSSAFASTMRLSPQHPPKAGKAGFVILLHDPHQSISGRFQTLTGLRALAEANPSVPFRFLVEGAYNGPSREIGLGGLESVIAPGSPTSPAIVQGLLQRFLINTPTAYRLLYDRAIPAYAIDDNELLTYPAPRPMRSISKQLDSLIAIGRGVEKATTPAALSELKTGLSQAVNLAFLFLTADPSDASDSMLADYFETIGQQFLVIEQGARTFIGAGIILDAAQVRAIGQDAVGYADEAAIYKKALGRNRTMAPQIIAASRNSSRVPIAFIGSYHTRGIVAELTKADIGYVVVEPRPRISATQAEGRAFDRANHSDTRRQYLASARLNMGHNIPTPAEVKEFLGPQIAARAPTVQADRSAVQARFAAMPNSAVDIEALLGARDRNGSFGGATIVGGNGLPPPPGDFGKSFAYFEPGGNGRGSRFVVADPSESRWRDRDRYSFLEMGLFMSAAAADGATPGRSATFYNGAGTRRLFFTVYEPQSKRTYCFEGNVQEAASMVPIPIGSAKGDDQNIRAQIVEILKTRVPAGE